MKLKNILFLCCLLMIIPTKVFAWVESKNATVDKIIQWQDDAPTYFILSSGAVCFIPADEKSMYTLILSLKATGKKAQFHCWDDEKVTQGISGHRIHRVIADR
ncbi:hypothetical protein L1D51_15085 [Pseudoalteromonas shioyasakiensis]|uniref:hypothetical protein n=1 Tax=Pseudoalteromonas shioyasakiensis TaxID=1190813 RepID=UPI001EFCD164|nr:hypothetical protein [Pseudoalteromonas shioyasakiensis]MCG9735319.1 hypothetical protein [Pseudoalteromonas shioyasakiensis]